MLEVLCKGLWEDSVKSSAPLCSFEDSKQGEHHQRCAFRGSGEAEVPELLGIGEIVQQFRGDKPADHEPYEGSQPVCGLSSPITVMLASHRVQVTPNLGKSPKGY